tara:strand:- start:6492 stop:6683 length:192 start_codon:yes stop_codon:yes gene_type:complete
MKDYQVMYIPRIQDELPVAEFDTLDSAMAHMEHIKKVKPKVYNFHYILDTKNGVKIDNDSGTR